MSTSSQNPVGAVLSLAQKHALRAALAGRLIVVCLHGYDPTPRPPPPEVTMLQLGCPRPAMSVASCRNQAGSRTVEFGDTRSGELGNGAQDAQSGEAVF